MVPTAVTCPLHSIAGIAPARGNAFSWVKQYVWPVINSGCACTAVVCVSPTREGLSRSRSMRITALALTLHTGRGPNLRTGSSRWQESSDVGIGFRSLRVRCSDPCSHNSVSAGDIRRCSGSVYKLDLEAACNRWLADSLPVAICRTVVCSAGRAGRGNIDECCQIGRLRG